MPLKPLKRRVGSKNYSTAGSVDTIELPRNFNYRKLMCRLVGTVDVSGGSASGAVHTYAALKAIDRIELIANGRDTIISVPPEALYVQNMTDYGTPGKLTNPADGSASNDKPIEAYFIIDLALVRAVRPIDTLFPAAGLSTLDLKITWGSAGDMFTGAFDRTATVDTTTQLQVMAFEEIGAIEGKFGVNKLFEIDRTISAASSNFQVQIPTGNAYRGFLFSTTADNVLVNTILDGISIESGTEVFQKWLSIEELQNYNKVQFSLEAALSGYYQVDFMDSDGRLTEILDARNLSNLDAILNVQVPGTVNKVKVYPQELILPAA